MNELMERNPNIIASEIEAIKNQTKIIVLSASMEIGKRLKEVKAMLPHGTWGTWLHDNVDYSERTAQNLMAVHETYSGMPQAAIEGISYSQAVALLGIEGELLTEAIEKNDIPDMTTAEVEDLARQLREEQQARAGMQLSLDLLKGADQREKATAADKAKVEKALKTATETAEKAQKEVKRLKAALEKPAEPPVEVIVEKVPEEVQRELDNLRRIAAKAPSAPVIKFRQIYEDIQTKTTQAVSCIAEIEKEDPETGAKYRGALRAACEGIIAKLDGGAA